MPYYWGTVWNEWMDYTSGTNQNTPNDLIADLAWWVLEHRLTPLGLYQDYESGHFRDPKTDEDCHFHNWFNEIYKCPHISFSSEHGGTIAYHLFTTDDSAHNITDEEASTLLHMLDCDTIKNYIAYLQNSTGIGFENEDGDITDDEEEDDDEYFSSDSEQEEEKVPDTPLTPNTEIDDPEATTSEFIDLTLDEGVFDDMPDLIDDSGQVFIDDAQWALHLISNMPDHGLILPPQL